MAHILGDRCPACGNGEPTPVLTIPAAPVFCNALWPTADEARAAATGRIELVLCSHCGLLWNAAFDADAVAYSPRYENSLHFSPTFRSYATQLAERLVARYDLRGGHVVEVGSGSAEFLGQLCELGGNRGTGFDPSYDPGAGSTHPLVDIVPALFPSDGSVSADFVTCQHVLEHVAEPGVLLGGIRKALSGQDPAGVAYCEVPDATYMLERGAVWDVMYEHCTYFAAPTLRRAFAVSGFEVLEVGTAFSGQYLWIEARPDDAATGEYRTDREAVDRLSALAESFQSTFDRALAYWNVRLAAMATEGPVALWGAGSKGVSFLNAVEGSEAIDAVIDVNPRKHGLFIPGTGQRVVRPEALLQRRPANVLLMNPAYKPEVRQTLEALGVEAELGVV